MNEQATIAPTISAPRTAALTASARIEQQFPSTPEGQLMRAVLKTSVSDLFDSDHSADARRHLQGPIAEAKILGIDPEWIRQQLRDAGVDLEGGE